MHRQGGAGERLCFLDGLSESKTDSLLVYGNSFVVFCNFICWKMFKIFRRGLDVNLEVQESGPLKILGNWIARPALNHTKEAGGCR